MTGLRAAIRRALSRRVSVAGMLEFGLWLLVPYVVIGLVWAFFHVEQVEQLEELLNRYLPAGADMGAYLLVGGLWPVYLVSPLLCGL
ncbi:hypothetical protein JDV09_06455 [Mycobacterium sp. Y57]|uniref:hypothetical protein n=1 Tax=Mycolicibacterium xanthum TaxID=2796469 RepID=UPI001C8419B9|nr:hypothetical protein [Mycolicibacterium xanthum]MBX7431751.1 hypothetical protein [Mycolicibacterium xanthum]